MPAPQVQTHFRSIVEPDLTRVHPSPAPQSDRVPALGPRPQSSDLALGLAWRLAWLGLALGLDLGPSWASPVHHRLEGLSSR